MFSFARKLRQFTPFISLCSLLLVAHSPAASTGTVQLSLADARYKAVADNPGLAEMQARYQALTHVASQSAALPDPVLSLNALNLPWDDFNSNQDNMTQMQVGISQMLPFPGKRGLREQIAELEAQAALHSAEEMRLRLDSNVAVTWWDVFFLDRSLETVQRNLRLLLQFVDVARTKYEVGRGLQQDVLLAQLERSKLLDQQIRLQALRSQRQIQLNVLMAVPPDTPVLLPSAMPDNQRGLAKQAELYRRSAQSRPLLDEQRAGIKAAETRLELAKKDRYPDFKLGVAYGARDDNELGESRQDLLSIRFSLNLPLYSGSKQSRAIDQRSGELARDHYALADQRNNVLSAISLAATDYQRASDQLKLFRDGIVPQARQTAESMLAGYQVDQVDFLNLVRSQMTLINYELQYWKSFTEVNQSIARLQAAVGEENIYE